MQPRSRLQLILIETFSHSRSGGLSKRAQFVMTFFTLTPKKAGFKKESGHKVPTCELCGDSVVRAGMVIAPLAHDPASRVLT
jgi:hypothetical protein